MFKRDIAYLLKQLSTTSSRNIVIIDFANVDRWQDSLGWKVGIRQLAKFIGHFSRGSKFLRRFYYGEDFGQQDRSTKLQPWSKTILTAAKYNDFEIISKRVKYIPDEKYKTGFIKKCNLDIEMVVDLFKERNNYDQIFIFSGDGDLAYACKYLHNQFHKCIYIFVARGHVGKELIDAKAKGIIENILFVEDFEYRLNLERR